jgi:FMN phosphatase YigB (HAD superfamily)
MRKRSAPSARPRRPPALPLLTTVIFDLDDTLYDCLRQRVRAAHRHAAAALARAGVPATVDQIFRARMVAFERDPTLSHIDAEVCRKFGVAGAKRMHQIAKQAYFSAPVGKLTLFPGARALLRRLKRRGVHVVIATFGDPATQQAKVRALGLDKEPAVDAIAYADLSSVVTKEAVFRRILREHERDPKKILVVGDRPSSEIRAGNQLGMHTVRLRHGEFRRLEPQGREEQAGHEIRDIRELMRLPYRFGLTD